MNAVVVSVNRSGTKGDKKVPVERAMLIENVGLQDDAHAGSGIRQVSLLAQESIETMQAKGLDVIPGSFAENITTKGIILPDLPVGTVVRVGREALLQVTRIGKVCHKGCHIVLTAGDCVMPREGIFARVLAGGPIQAGDDIDIVEQGP